MGAEVGQVLEEIPPDGRRLGKGGAGSKYQPMLDNAGGKWVVLYRGHSHGTYGRVRSAKWFDASLYEITSRRDPDTEEIVVYGRRLR